MAFAPGEKRRPNTGWIKREGRWIAYTPKWDGGKQIGRYDTRREAERALDGWLAEHPRQRCG